MIWNNRPRRWTKSLQYVASSLVLHRSLLSQLWHTISVGGKRLPTQHSVVWPNLKYNPHRFISTLTYASVQLSGRDHILVEERSRSHSHDQGLARLTRWSCAPLYFTDIHVFQTALLNKFRCFMLPRCISHAQILQRSPQSNPLRSRTLVRRWAATVLTKQQLGPRNPNKPREQTIYATPSARALCRADRAPSARRKRTLEPCNRLLGPRRTPPTNRNSNSLVAIN